MKRTGSTNSIVITMFVIYLFVTIPIAFWTDRNLEFLLGHFKGVAVNVPFWLSWIVTVICNAFILAFNVICEILHFVF